VTSFFGIKVCVLLGKRQDGFALNFFPSLGENSCSLQPALCSVHPAFKRHNNMMALGPEKSNVPHRIRLAKAHFKEAIFMNVF